jgi:hypothetical protein
MPTTRTPIGRGPHKPHITPEMIAAFKLAMQGDGEAEKILHYRLLHRAPWQEFITDVDTDEAPDYIKCSGEACSHNAATWAEARKIRVAIEEAARQ